MPTSAPGNRGRRTPVFLRGCSRRRRGRGMRGFTMIELLIVVAIIALSVSLIAMALPDGDAARLEEEGARLSALLETARAEARVSGATVRWVPHGAAAGQPGPDAEGKGADFRFVGLPAALALPTRWLDERVSAQVVGASTLLLGPEAMLPPQRVLLRLGERQLELASDGIGPFAPADAASAAQP